MNTPSSPLKTLYCHGLPGSGEEIASLLPETKPHIQTLKPLDFESFERLIVDHPPSRFHVIGFSLGAMTALKLAAHFPENVSRLSLISPAAPLELGDFLPSMAGRPVFNMALKGAGAFAVFTAFQWLGVRIAPNRIIQTMFAGSPEADVALLLDDSFQAALLYGLKRSLGQESRLYRRAILTYVQPWAHILGGITCPVTLHHGALDNWTPLSMTHALEGEIGSSVDVKIYERLGHYAALQTALPLCL